MGAMIVGGASLTAAIYSQWYQGRLQMMHREANKREAIYGEFIMSASKAVVKASITDNLSWTRDEQHLIGLINRMRLFAPPGVITEAEAVIRILVGIALQPKRELNELAKTTLTDRSVPDLLLLFSLASQTDLKNIYRPTGKRYFKIVLRAVAGAGRYLRDRIAQVELLCKLVKTGRPRSRGQCVIPKFAGRAVPQQNPGPANDRYAAKLGTF